MSELSKTSFKALYGLTGSIFPDNNTEEISEGDVRQFGEDIADSLNFSAETNDITSWKSPCSVATTVNITLSGEQTIDGVLTSTSRVLVKNQSTSSANGIYISDAGAWARSSDADSGAELEGAAVGVTLGTTQQNTVWLQISDSISLGSTAIQWQQIGFGAVSQNLSSVLTTGNDGGAAQIKNIADPTIAQDAATKAYVDAYSSSGTWTPTVTHIANITSTTPDTFQYIRIGSVVNFSGAITIQAVAAGGTEIEFSLPFASNFASATQCSGMGSNGVSHGRVSADATNNRAEFAYSATGSSSTAFFIHGTYLII